MDWVNILQQCSGSAGAVLQYLHGVDWPVESLRDSAPTPNRDEPYGRCALHAGPEGEVMIMGWRPGGMSAPHDHGTSAGYVVLLEGRFTEAFWRFGPDGFTQTPEHHLEAPATVPVGPGSIHSICSIDAGLSLHIYTPAIKGMRVYDREGRRTLVVTDDCGAWIPRDQRHIIEVDPWG